MKNFTRRATTTLSIAALIIALSLYPSITAAHDEHGPGSGVTISNTQPLADYIRTSGLNNDVTNAINFSLNNYAHERFSEHTLTVTIDPSELKLENSTLYGKVSILKKTIPFEAFIPKSQSNTAVIVTINKNSTSSGGPFVYIKGIDGNSDTSFTIRQVNSTTTDLIISGHKEKALRYINSLGYKVPDFTITFANYRSPFE